MSHKHISRVHTGKTNGWQVRLMRNKIKHSKFFSLKRFGGLEEALKAAQGYRDSQHSLAPPSKANSVNLSPDAGLRLETTGSYKAWVGSWVDENGTRKTRKFSVRKHGNLRAKQLARKARQLGIARLNQPEPTRQKPKPVPTLAELVEG